MIDYHYSIHKRENSKTIYLVDMKQSNNPYISLLARDAISKYANANIVILAHHKGYNHSLVCDHCGYIPMCKHCDLPLAHHIDSRGDFFAMCNICQSIYPKLTSCNMCTKGSYIDTGLGIQKLAEMVGDIAPSADIYQLYAGKLNSPNKISKNTPSHGIYIGTSILSTPPRHIPKRDLMIIQNADIGLFYPAYDSMYNSFHTMYHMIQNYNCNNIIIQSYNTTNPMIYTLAQGKYQDFVNYDMSHRAKLGYPPYGEICSIITRDELEMRLFHKVNKLYQELLYLRDRYMIDAGLFADAQSQIDIYATPPVVYRKYGKYRYNIVLKGREIRKFLDIAFGQLRIYDRGFKLSWGSSGVD